MPEYNTYQFDGILKKINDRLDKLECCCYSFNATNLGLGEGIFYHKTRNGVLEFKSLLPGNNMSLSSNNNSITINSTYIPPDCDDIKDCIGITPSGATNKYLNEQGNFVTASGSGFSCTDLSTCSTTNLPEGTNLYYTSARFNSSFSSKTTTDLTEGSNLYFTSPRAVTALTGQNVSIFTNDSGYITSSALSPYLLSSTAASTYEPIIAPGTTAQYWRGDKTWQNFPTIPTVTPSALTKTDDTNLTITLGGSPSTALLQATSLTLGWTGTLADSRITSATTWNNKLGYVLRTTTDSTPVTGSIANTLSYSDLILGNTIIVGNYPELTVAFRRTGTASTSIMRTYVNTSASLSGATLIAVLNIGANQLSGTMERDFAVKSSTATEAFSLSNTTNTNIANSTNAFASINIDWTTDKYLIVAFQNASAADSLLMSSLKFIN
jgi:hypothetical protein